MLDPLDGHVAALFGISRQSNPNWEPNTKKRGMQPATAEAQLAITRTSGAPPRRVFRAFTDPDHFASWWEPLGNSLPRDETDFDVRAGAHQR